MNGILSVRHGRIAVSYTHLAVQTLSIELDSSETYRWNVTRTKDEEKSTDDTTYYNYTVADASGTTKDYTAFTNLYQVLTSETVLEDAGDTEPTGTPLFRAVVEYYDGALTNTLEFYPDGERNCVVVLDDVCLLYTSDSWSPVSL